MKVISPILITDSTLLASDQPETEYPAWTSGATFGNKDRTIRAHSVYESLKPANAGHDPLTDDTKTWWNYVGPSNRWAMFDASGGTLTTGTGEINVSIKPGAIDSLAVLDTDADIVRVIMTDGGHEVYNQAQATNVGGEAITDWLLYFSAPIGRRSKLTFLDLPPFYPNATVAVEFDGVDPAGPVSVGTLAVGRTIDVGLTLVGGTLGLNDYSLVNTNAFGAMTIVRRGFSNLMTQPFTMLKEDTDAVVKTMAGLRATPAVWIGEEDYLDAVILYGPFTAFSIDLTYTDRHYGSLTINSLSQN